MLLRKRGGLDCKVGIIHKHEQVEQEKERIRKEVYQLLKTKTFSHSYTDSVNAQHIISDELQELIQETKNLYEAEEIDGKIVPITLIGGAVGAAIGGTIGGIVWGIQMICTGYMFYLLAVGLSLLCNACVKFFTKQFYKNWGLLVFTVIASFYALGLGEFL